ncbi:dynamin family protein [Massilia yuzhufengensis]|uniref:Replication fork clamp-binding protein CrfC (Dynamin-like GTPase family) n=1 Tax=Massilia yuzhufengensis TaxID=1164594 RepID=A0A1I1VY92_9BURK|nr:dynamin family protein [Massilia yuzhufengensis]SFD87937.1 Replication fork clamp-binding protein CrfC (dynamin-like GTPase family) [Massilia yuzhufengensis]
MQELQEYGAWRAAVAGSLEAYGAALREHALVDGAGEQHLDRALARLRDDRLSVAFVAEFSRGKTELINAIFFADYGQRILPSSAGRTTMCPTELLYDAALPPCIRLLPIETRVQHLSTSDFRDDAASWTVLPLDLDAPERMSEAFRQVSQTRRVPAAQAERYGLWDPEDPDMATSLGADGTVEIPQWRHAIINLPHPLLKQGLVILDTPGLNAIGTEPELTLKLIPNAHAVLFVLAAETGVTKSDIDVWRTHIGNGPGRLAVLNKIDAMWDELRTPQENDAEIARQQQDVAQMLGLDSARVYPVSAQKALVGKINGDMALYEKSRLATLEAALFHDLVPARRDIVQRQLRQELEALAAGQAALAAARTRDLVEQLQELRSLRGKNQGVIAHMMRRVDAEKKEFDASLLKLQGTRAVFARLSTELYSTLGMDTVQDQGDAVRAAMQASRFATGMRAPVRSYFEAMRAHLDASATKVAEIGAMMDSMIRKFATEHGLALASPMPLSLERYRRELDEVEALFLKQFGTATLLMTSRATLLERFFDSIASRVRHIYRSANLDAEAWLKVIMAPLEAAIRQHRDQLRHRQASIGRIFEATDSLEQKISAFEATQRALEDTRALLARMAAQVAHALENDKPAA